MVNSNKQSFDFSVAKKFEDGSSRTTSYNPIKNHNYKMTAPFRNIDISNDQHLFNISKNKEYLKDEVDTPNEQQSLAKNYGAFDQSVKNAEKFKSKLS